MAQPRKDPFWAGLGEDLEDLSRVNRHQPWSPRGLSMSRTAVDLLGRATAGALSTKRYDQAQHDAVAELQRLDLLTQSLQLSEDGTKLAMVLLNADRRVRVEAAHGDMAFSFDAQSAKASTVIISTDSPTQWAGRDHSGAEALAVADRLDVQWVPTMWLPGEIAAWLGVGPAWPMDFAPQELPMQLITDRVEEPLVKPPADADERLLEIWGQPWFLWTLQTGAEHGLAGVAAGVRGHLSLTRMAGGNQALLQPWPSEMLFASLIATTLES